MAVVGAGPAGARAAELLARGGMDVLLFDPRAPWEKPCGGGIPVHALDHFPELRELGSSGRWVERARLAEPVAGGLEIDAAAPLLLVDRRVLSRFQLERATAAGARHVARRIRELSPAAAGYRLVDDEGGVYDVAFVIGADGASSRMRRLLSPALQPVQTPTRGRFVPIARDAAPELVVAFPEGFPGYVWEFPRGETTSVGVCHLERGATREDLEAVLLAHIAAAGGTADHPDYGHPIPLLRGEDYRRPERFGGARWALCGDAAGLVDPITGEGIHYALRSGELAARALLAAGSLAGYAPALEREILRQLAVAHRYAGRFYRRGFPRVVIEVCRASPRMRRVLANILAGRQSYTALRRSALGALLRDRVGWRSVAAVLRFVR
ncbi:MAG TPA: NAD(P)/FAD-dependent oxidoreductase [Longimicrobiales bacterium]